jgi:hypothetical protein
MEIRALREIREARDQKAIWVQTENREHIQMDIFLVPKKH